MIGHRSREPRELREQEKYRKSHIRQQKTDGPVRDVRGVRGHSVLLALFAKFAAIQGVPARTTLRSPGAPGLRSTSRGSSARPA